MELGIVKFNKDKTQIYFYVESDQGWHHAIKRKLHPGNTFHFKNRTYIVENKKIRDVQK